MERLLFMRTHIDRQTDSKKFFSVSEQKKKQNNVLGLYITNETKQLTKKGEIFR